MSLRTSYQQKGFIVLRRVISPSSISPIRAALTAQTINRKPTRSVLFTHQEPAETRSMTELMFQHRNVLHEDDIILKQVLFDIMAAITPVVGYEPLPFQDVSLVKQPDSPEFPWHQDLPFWPVDRDDGCVAWMAIDGTRKENGALQVAPGSHLSPLGPAIDLHTGQPQPGSSAATITPEATSTLILDPGDLALFHARTLHRSGPNNTNRSRQGLAISFVHPDTRWSRDRAPCHPLCRTITHGEVLRPWSFKTYQIRPA